MTPPRSHLWLLAFAFAFAVSLTPSPMKLIAAPDLLLVGTPENIFVECLGCTGENIPVKITVMNHPTNTKVLVTTSVTLTSGNHFQALGQIRIPVADFCQDPNKRQFVTLRAQFPDRLLETVVLVSMESDYIFIQTDQQLYSPNATVRYRMFALPPRMEPVERDEEIQTNRSIDIEIVPSHHSQPRLDGDGDEHLSLGDSPDGINQLLEEVTPTPGIHSGLYQLPPIVSTGLWKVVAKFHSNPLQYFSAEFEVKEYVLPNFEVKLTPSSSFFYKDSQELTVNIRATYLFGGEVQGQASAVFGVVHGGQKSILASIQREEILNGNGVVKLDREAITQTFKDIDDLVGSSIFVAVSVLTESGSDMVEAELRGIRIVTSPYTINCQRRTHIYFKPGMPFDVTIEVMYPDGTPAKGVAVVVTPGDVRGFTAANGIAKLTINTEAGRLGLSITAKTNDPHLREDRQASASMYRFGYDTKTKNYIHIDACTSDLELGDNLKIGLILFRRSNEDTDITYLIMSRGQLVKHGRYRTRGQVYVSLIVPITKEMVPSFRIIAYYLQNDIEVVSDSVRVEVKDSCTGSLKLESSRAVPSYAPREMFGLKVTGDPEATVGLLAVDKGINVLNNKHRLTQRKVLDLVERFDTGCTHGGEFDSMDVFFNAGLLFHSSTEARTPFRRDLTCEGPRRWRRSTAKDVTASLLSLYNVQIQRECCLAGMQDTSLRYTCERRSEYISDGAACVDAFLHCCQEIENQRARKDDSDDRMASRTGFPEGWLWEVTKLPACPPQAPNCDSTSLMKYVPLPDSITTWQLTGISLSRTHGVCVGEPLEVIVRKDFFIDLRLPYSAVRGEQLEVKAILHNYRPADVTVLVDLMEAADVCSAASDHSSYRQEVRVGAQTTRSVPFVIIPMKHGEFHIEVKAAVEGSDSLADGIKKRLRVVPQGVLVKSLKVITLDPTNNGAGGKEEITLNSAIPEKDVAPNTPRSTQISVTAAARENVGLLVENLLSDSIFRHMRFPTFPMWHPWHMAPTVFVTTYLDKTNLWGTVNFQRNEALQHIRSSYQGLLHLPNKDGSFSFWTLESSTWDTALMVKLLFVASRLTTVKTDVICSSVKFLILRAQRPDGEFREVGPEKYYLRGAARGPDDDASLTAFCLIAMQESRTLCANTVDRLPGSVDKAVAYLVKRLPGLTNPLAVAITSYALANEGKLDRDTLFKFASPELNRWPVAGGEWSDTLEATSYAVLALVKAQAWEDAGPAVRWIARQGMDYIPSLYAIIAFQAVAEYWNAAEEPEYDLNVDILLPGRAEPDKYNFNKNNNSVTRTSTTHDINKNVTVTATGTGEATVRMVSLYYALPTEKESDCQKFDMSVQLIPENMGADEKIYKLRIEVLYQDKDRDATMAILDIGLLTGFSVDTKDLDLLSKGRAPTIAGYEMDTLLSERGSLIIYLHKVLRTRPEEIIFRVHQKMRVGVLQPAAVSVREHHDQTQCVKFYHPVREAGQPLRLCRDEECTCKDAAVPWYQFDGRSYRYFASPVTWADAERHCVSEGAHLVSIHSEKENTFVTSLIKPDRYTWIGIRDQHHEGRWVWSDGSAFNFVFWGIGEPNNALKGEDCGHINIQKWNDNFCSSNYSFVCVWG